jgi:hypothetical protein
MPPDTEVDQASQITDGAFEILIFSPYTVYIQNNIYIYTYIIIQVIEAPGTYVAKGVQEVVLKHIRAAIVAIQYYHF